MASKPQARKPAPAPAKRAAPAPQKPVQQAQRAPAQAQRAPAPAQAQTPKSPEQTRAVATQSAAVPAHLQKWADQYEGAGLSTDAADNLVPLIYILQAQSKQCLRQRPEFIDGAQAGDIWMRGSPDTIRGEDPGIIVQPCLFDRVVLEWVPRDDGGGFVGRHTEMPEDAENKPDPQNPNRPRWMSPRGTEYIETREFVCRVHGDDGSREPFVIPMAGSNHTVARNWMTSLNRLSTGGKRLPAFASLWRLTTVPRSNDQGDWYAWNVKFEGFVEEDLDIEEGAKLFTAFSSGEKTTDTAGYEDLGGGSGEEVGTGDDNGPV